MELTRGTTLGAYEILDQIGAGGMGEVYRARDSRLGREVAVKMLPAAFALDSDRLARFQREAQLLASLNHPNIAIIHELEEVGGSRYLILEMVAGATLAERIASGPVPIDDALDIAQQIAEALQAAHERGIIHRDLKPANVKITPEGRVKVLDFGLAKMHEPVDSTSNMSNSPTLSVMQTEGGVILGTAAYMSPEQARGKNVDRRTDIWAFGCVLFEMLAGRQTFPNGETVADTIVGVLSTEPDWRALPAAIPGKIRGLIERCLRKDTRRRLPDIAEARIQIEEAREELGANPRAAAAPPLRSRWPVYVGAAMVSALLLATTAVTVRHFVERPMETPVVRFDISVPQNTGNNNFGTPFISPDGKNLAFVLNPQGKSHIWVRALDSSAAQPIPSSEGALPQIFWSPDSRQIAFTVDGKLKKVAAAGGPAQTIGNLPESFPYSGTWNAEGIILLGGVTNQSTALILRVSAMGGEPVPLMQLDATKQELAHLFPIFLPDGRHFFYFVRMANGNAVYIGELGTAARHLVSGIDSSVKYSPSGHLLFQRESALMAQPFDVDRLQLHGEARTVVESFTVPGANNLPVSVSATGIVAYRIGARGGAADSQLTWFDRGGKPMGQVGAAGAYSDPELSRDGNHVAFRRGVDVWTLDIRKDLVSKVTSGARPKLWPVWSPDGKKVVYRSPASGTSSEDDLHEQAVDVVGKDKLLLNTDEWKNPSEWSPDGRYLAYYTSSFDIWALPMPASAETKPLRITETPSRETWSRISPDSRWIAYQSNDTGREEVFIQSFPQPGVRQQVSTTGGYVPHWSHDGKELFYVAPDSRLMSVSLKPTATSPGASAPVVLFQGTFADPTRKGNFNVAPDGRFLINVPLSEQSVPPITVILNWASTLKEAR